MTSKHKNKCSQIALLSLLALSALGACEGQQDYYAANEACADLEEYRLQCEEEKCSASISQSMFEQCFGDKSDLDLSTPWLDYATWDWEQEGARHVDLTLNNDWAPSQNSTLMPFGLDRQAVLRLDNDNQDGADPCSAQHIHNDWSNMWCHVGIENAVRIQLQEQGFGAMSASLGGSLVNLAKELTDKNITWDDVFTTIDIPLSNTQHTEMGVRLTASWDGSYFITFHALHF